MKRSISPVYKRPKHDTSSIPHRNDGNPTFPNDTPSLSNHYHSAPTKYKAKHKKCSTLDPSTLDTLSPKSKKKMSVRRRSYMGMSKKQLQKECKKHQLARSMTLSSDKKGMVDILLLTEFGSEKKGKKGPRKKGKDKDDDEELELSGASTWRSEDHRKRSKHLKKAHDKKSYRYDEALNVKNDRASALFDILNDIELEKESRKDKAKMETGRSLIGDELTEVQGDAMIDTLSQHYDSKKKGGGKSINFAASDSKSSSNKVHKRAQTMRAKTVKNKRNTYCASPKAEEPKFRSVQYVPPQKQRKGSRRRSDAGTMKKKGGIKKRFGSVSRGSTPRKKGKGKKFDIKTSDDEDEPELSTWRSGDHHKRTKHLKKAHEKKSYRYDEALDVKNDRASALFDILNDIELEKETRKKKAKMEKGRSLFGDELTEVEGDALIDTLGQYFDSKKKGCAKSAEIEKTFQMVTNDEDSESEVDLNSCDEVKMNKHAVNDSSEDLADPLGYAQR